MWIAIHRTPPLTAQLSTRQHPIYNSKLLSQVPRKCLDPSFHKGHRRSFVITAAAKKFASFQEMISQSDVVLVDFYAAWCGPCVMMAQIMV
jgi:thiol-disulfide isomerase/thioredoxin